LHNPASILPGFETTPIFAKKTMRKTYILWVTLSFLLVVGCKSKTDHKEHENGSETSVADSLYDKLLKEHEIGMKDWMKIEGRKKQIKSLLDSLATLPGKADDGITELKNKLNEATTGLQKAYNDMDTWMISMNLDSAKNDLKQRIKYLTEENERASQVNEAIVKSLQKADSLLKAKF
jgi:hypothetical protein